MYRLREAVNISELSGVTFIGGQSGNEIHCCVKAQSVGNGQRAQQTNSGADEAGR